MYASMKIAWILKKKKGCKSRKSLIVFSPSNKRLKGSINFKFERNHVNDVYTALLSTRFNKNNGEYSSMSKFFYSWSALNPNSPRTLNPNCAPSLALNHFPTDTIMRNCRVSGLGFPQFAQRFSSCKWQNIEFVLIRTHARTRMQTRARTRTHAHERLQRQTFETPEIPKRQKR